MQSDWLLGECLVNFALASSLGANEKHNFLLIKQTSSCLWFMYLKEISQQGDHRRQFRKQWCILTTLKTLFYPKLELTKNIMKSIFMVFRVWSFGVSYICHALGTKEIQFQVTSQHFNLGKLKSVKHSSL